MRGTTANIKSEWIIVVEPLLSIQVAAPCRFALGAINPRILSPGAISCAHWGSNPHSTQIRLKCEHPVVSFLKMNSRPDVNRIPIFRLLASYRCY